MKTKALEAIMRGIAPVIRTYVATAQHEQHLRMAAEIAVLRSSVKSLAELTRELEQERGADRERLAVLETRPLVPGPQGDPGPAGKDGADGKAGMTYQGVFVDGKSYQKGDVVTWAGSMWHADDTTTTKPGEWAGAKNWTMCVKRGRDGSAK